jgi:hypothetical protein
MSQWYVCLAISLLVGCSSASSSPVGEDGGTPEAQAAGDRIYFHRRAPSTGGKWHVFSIHPDGTGLVDLTPNETSNNEYPGN